MGGMRDEVIADLISAFLINRGGEPWSSIMKSLGNWRNTDIFDDANEQNRGHHPVGDMRVTYIKSLFSLLASGESFEDAVKAIIWSLHGATA